MVEFIALIIFIISIGGIALIIAKKIPALCKLPQNGGTGFMENGLVLQTQEKITKIYSLFQKQVILHKLLSWLKILVLKVETQIDHLLHSVRKKAKEQKEKDLKK